MTTEKTNHKDNGDFDKNNEYKFDSQEGQEKAEEHSWSNKREEILKRFGKWDEGSDDE